MSSVQTPTPSNVSRLTGFVLGLIVFACVSMIGLAGYLKYELDRAQNELAAPETVLTSDQEGFDRFRRSLGYSGFVGMAQSYASDHDANSIPAMKEQIKEANDILAHLPEKTNAETRHDLQAVLATFDASLQKIEKSADDPASGFTINDMAPLYAALPVLDARINEAAAANRVVAQNNVQFWSMLLTLVSWCSLIVAAALAAGIYLTLRDRNSTPLRALSQSVKNMARGDMRTAIWGIERQDTVGELARAVDMARFQFSQLPDMALLSEQGPVRIRFEGNTRSLFEAMMRVISRDSEQVHQQAAALTEAINQQQQAITNVTYRVDTILQAVQKHTLEGDQTLRGALQNVITSADMLKHSQEHAADQLNRIIPYMQERAQGLAEITQITGKQVAQVLHTLLATDRNLKANAESGEATIRKLASTADGLGERLFGAVNLLQASGKVLAETTETTRSRLEEAIEKLNLRSFAAGFVPATPPAPQGSAEPVQDNFLREKIGNLGEAIRHIIARLDTLSIGGPVVSSEPSGDINGRLTELLLMVSTISEKLSSLTIRGDGAPAPAQIQTDVIMIEMKTGFEVLGQSLERTREQLRALAISSTADPNNLSAQMRDQWGQMAGQLEATRAALEQTIAQQISRIEARVAEVNGAVAAAGEKAQSGEGEVLREAQQQVEQQSQILSELVATLGLLDAHVQEIRSQVSANRQKAG